MDATDFWSFFNTEVSAIESSDAASAESRYASLQRSINEVSAAGSLPAHDIAGYMRRLASLQGIVESKSSNESLARTKPKKFSFKSTRTAAHPARAPQSQSPVVESAPAPVRDAEDTIVMADMADVEVDSRAYVAKSGGSIIIRDLHRCLVDLSTMPHYATAYLSRLKACRVKGLRAEGSIMLHDCNDCIIAGSAQQWRIHDSRETTVLYSSTDDTKRPIIEHCEGMHFRRQDSKGETLVEDFSDLSGIRRNWKALDDNELQKALASLGVRQIAS